MNRDHIDIIEEICSRCGGICCIDAHPPVSAGRKDLILADGRNEDAFEFCGYQRLAARADGTCVMLKDGRCQIHGIKPETCVSGPFTFDLRGNVLEIFLKGKLSVRSQGISKRTAMPIPGSTKWR